MIKITVTTTYKGVKYDNPGDAFKQSVLDQMREDFSKKLKPFKKEIEECKGEVIINIPDNLKKASFRFIDIPDELRERIIASLK